MTRCSAADVESFCCFCFCASSRLTYWERAQVPTKEKIELRASDSRVLVHVVRYSPLEAAYREQSMLVTATHQFFLTSILLQVCCCETWQSCTRCCASCTELIFRQFQEVSVETLSNRHIVLLNLVDLTPWLSSWRCCCSGACCCCRRRSSCWSQRIWFLGGGKSTKQLTTP